MSLVRIGSKPPPSFDDPVAVLESCHRKIEQLLAGLVRAAAAPSHPETASVLRDVIRYFDTGGVKHTLDEEASIFPRVRGEGKDELLESLEAEHRTAEAIYLAVRTVAQRIVDAPDSAAETAASADLATQAAALDAAYREHIVREEAELFPLIRALDAPQLRAIGLEMKLRRG